MNLKMLGLAVLSAMAFTALGASSASATTLEVGGSAQNSAVTYTETLKSGTSLIIKDTSGIASNTCTSSDVHWDSLSPYLAAKIGMLRTTTTLTNCTRPIIVHKAGGGSIQWTSGTNGTVSSKESEVTVGSPIGTLNCKTGAETHIGTLAGVASGNATVTINAVINCGIIPSTKWEASFSVTSPGGLGVVS